MSTKKRELNWKAITTIAGIIVVLFVILFVTVNNVRTDKTSETNLPETQISTSEETITPIDDLMADFQGTDEEVIAICETELQALGIDYVSIDQPLEGTFIQETRVGTYELNGILRTPSVSPDMPQPKSTEMLCTVFPGDEYPVEITFGQDW